jgi:hypothetical protein
MRQILLVPLVLAACVNSRDAAAGKTELSADSTAISGIGVQTASAQSPAPSGNIPASVMKLRTDPQTPIRGLYVNRFSSQSTK